MATWAEIRQDILVMLDSKSDLTTSSDLRNSVDRQIVSFRDWLYRKKCPLPLRPYTPEVAITASTEYIDITGAGAGANPGLNLGSDYARLMALSVSDTSGEEGEEWTFTPWPSWIRLKNVTAGDQRFGQSFTIDFQKRIYLHDVPTGSETWYAVLHYEKYPGAIVDVDEPEIDKAFHDIFTTGVVRKYPNLFEGEERVALLAQNEKRFREVLMDYLGDTEGAIKARRLRPAVRKRRSTSIFWGNGEVS